MFSVLMSRSWPLDSLCLLLACSYTARGVGKDHLGAREDMDQSVDRAVLVKDVLYSITDELFLVKFEAINPWIWVVIWSVGGNREKTGNCNNPIIICLKENAQSPSLGLKYNEQRVGNSSLRPVLEKEELAVTMRWSLQVLWDAREKIAPAHPWVDKPGKGEAPQPPPSIRGRPGVGGGDKEVPHKAHGARGLVPEHVHGSGILSENARIPTQRSKALWDRKGRKPKQDLARTSRNCLPARRKVDVAFFPCHLLPPHDSGVGRQGKEAQELMVPVNGTRVGRGGSFLNLNATGTAGPRVLNDEQVGRVCAVGERGGRWVGHGARSGNRDRNKTYHCSKDRAVDVSSQRSRDRGNRVHGPRGAHDR
ncbi:hypothetical protein EDB87DRAFT_1573378 [Lactarius vividus]|nr:hypothetical protein EDB87DRAFT_1573378 [Lactarius vividus]